MSFEVNIAQILAVVVAFQIGWLSASQNTRAQVFNRRLEVYQKLNRLAANVLHESIKFETDASIYSASMVQARLTLSEYVVENSLMLSEATATHLAPLVASAIPPDVNAILVGLNGLTAAMSKELRLDSIHSINNLLSR